MTTEGNKGHLAVVELLGLPGAGKTTVVESIASSETIDVMSRYRSVANAPAYAMATLRLAPAITRARPWKERSWKDCNKMIRLESSASIARRHARRGAEAFIFDQGPLFLLAQLGGADGWGSAAFERRGAEILRRWGETLDLALVLDASDDVLLQRIRSRGKCHALQHASEDIALRTLRLQRRSFDILLAEVRRHGARTQRIDTSAASVGATVAAVLQSVASVTALRQSEAT